MLATILPNVHPSPTEHTRHRSGRLSLIQAHATICKADALSGLPALVRFHAPGYGHQLRNPVLRLLANPPTVGAAASPYIDAGAVGGQHADDGF